MLLPQQGFLQKPALNSWSPGSCVADLSDSEVVTVTYASERNQGTLYLSLCLKSLQFAPNKTSQMVHLAKTVWPWQCVCTCLWAGLDRADMRSAAQDGKLPGLARTAQPLRALLWAVLVAEGVGRGCGT